MINLYRNIETQLSGITDDELLKRISNEINAFRMRFRMQQLTYAELLRVSSMIANYCNYQIINLKIAIRLEAGLFHCAEKLGLDDPLEIANLLVEDDGCQKLIDLFQQLGYSQAFFDKPRKFYSNRDISLIRQRNLNNILALSSTASINDISSHFESTSRLHEVQMLISGAEFPTSDFIARQIEQFLQLKNGELDRAVSD
ncbi:hypothetical protein [Photobacterium leiognathi]|uniref:hypothetical protein n=1 Tax=Photobacterium leiognathi TaxID=553611 RepID=UPI002981F91A|nr:hypothetical protein [Photobacterium leiognathi]